MAGRMPRTPCPVCGSRNVIRAEPTCVRRIDVWSDNWVCRACEGRRPALLMGPGVLDRFDGCPPLPFLDAVLEPGSEDAESAGLRLRLRSDGAARRPVAGPESDLLLDVIGAPTTVDGGNGLSITCRSDEGLVVEHLLRQVLPSDAAWLSSFGFAARPDIEMLRELAVRRAAGRDTTEQAVVLALPRLAPHAVVHRIGDDHDVASWIRCGSRWQRLRGPDTPITERMQEIARQASMTPWLDGRVGTGMSIDPTRLLEGDLWSLRLLPWGLEHAFARIARPVAEHDELAFVLLASEPDTVVTLESLGPGLSLTLIAMVDRVHDAAAAHAEIFGSGDDDVDDGQMLELDWQDPTTLFGGGTSGWRLRQQALALRAEGFRTTARELVELLELFDEHSDGLADVIAAARAARAWSGVETGLLQSEDASL